MFMQEPGPPRRSRAGPSCGLRSGVACEVVHKVVAQKKRGVFDHGNVRLVRCRGQAPLRGRRLCGIGT